MSENLTLSRNCETRLFMVLLSQNARRWTNFSSIKICEVQIVCYYATLKYLLLVVSRIRSNQRFASLRILKTTV